MAGFCCVSVLLTYINFACTDTQHFAVRDTNRHSRVRLNGRRCVIRSFNITTYITEDDSLICFELSSEVVVRAVRRNFLTGKAVYVSATNRFSGEISVITDSEHIAE